jgi:hypothetical protein
MTRPFPTIRGRWFTKLEESGIDLAAPLEEQTSAELLFYAGFAAALNAIDELADYPQDQARALILALHSEMHQLAELTSVPADHSRAN